MRRRASPTAGCRDTHSSVHFRSPLICRGRIARFYGPGAIPSRDRFSLQIAEKSGIPRSRTSEGGVFADQERPAFRTFLMSKYAQMSKSANLRRSISTIPRRTTSNAARPVWFFSRYADFSYYSSCCSPRGFDIDVITCFRPDDSCSSINDFGMTRRSHC